MLLFFLKNRRGSITIMLSFLLIVVLSVNSSFLETARYRALERLYKELEESAVFSVLSQYDRDLFKNYGLLAMDAEVDKDTFLHYLLNNLNSELEGANGADSLLKFSEDNVKFEKLYDLAQEEVFAMQVNEFCAYRAPANFINNTFNIEEILKELIKDLEEAVPILNTFNNLCKSAQKIFDAFEKLADYQDKSDAFKDQRNEYEKCVDEYNAAVKERDDYIAAEHTEEEDYEGILKSKCDAVKTKADLVRNSLKATETSLGEFYESYKSFVDSFDAMQSANIKSIISGAKADAAALSDENSRENAKAMVDGMEKAYKESENMFSRMVKVMDDYTENDIRISVERMEDQKLLLEGKGEELGEVSYVEIQKPNSIWTAARMLAESIKQISQLVEQWAEMFAAVGDLLDMLKEVSTAGVYTPTYNHTLGASFTEQLPGRQHNGYRLVSVNNAFAGEDESRVSEQIEKTKEVAAYTGFDTGSLKSNDKGEENLLLQKAMGRTLDAETAFRAQCAELKSSWGFWELLTVIPKLQKVVGTLLELIESIINLIQVFISAASPELLQDILYQKFNAATYGTEMFSNRVTDTGADKKLNGSSFPDYSSYVMPGGNYFAMANGEYIVHGDTSEIENQTYVFELMLVFRMLCNIPGMLANKTVMDIVTGLCESLIGIIIAVILVLLVLLVEGWLDMFFMIYGGEEVDIIKMESYIKFENGGVSEDFKKKVKNLTENIRAINQGEENGSEKTVKKDKDYGKEYVNGLIQWDYKDHLFLIMILFVPSQVIYARSADLIEMQMKHEKAIKGEDFKLKEMATYVRIKSSVTYKPLLPVPIIPGLNQDGLKITNMHYSGY